MYSLTLSDDIQSQRIHSMFHVLQQMNFSSKSVTV